MAVIICNIFCCHATITELDDVNFVEYENKRLQKFLGHRSSQERGVAGNDISTDLNAQLMVLVCSAPCSGLSAWP